MNFTPALLAPLIAFLASLWFSACYAWNLGDTTYDKYGLVGFAIAIAIGNASFLAVASNQFRDRLYARALALVVLWGLCFGVSITTGFAYFIGNRMASTADEVGRADERQRAQVTHDTATADLKAAKTSEFWTVTKACTSKRTTKQKDFCTNVGALTDTLDMADATLTRIVPVTPNPEITALADLVGFSFSQVLTVLSLSLATIIELIASLGFYAVRGQIDAEPSTEPQDARETPPRSDGPQNEKPPLTPPQRVSTRGLDAMSGQPSAPDPAPMITWSKKVVPVGSAPGP